MDRGLPSCPSQSLEVDLASAQGDLQKVPREWLLLDLEGGPERVYQIGAVFCGHVFERRGRFDLPRALRELDGFADAARAVLGHNILDHDLPILKQAAPELRLFQKPVIDTLFLSPLAFPENPYHRLVKDHKLVKDSVNDPVADARLAARVFCDQMRSFQVLAEAGSSDILAFYRYCFDSAGSVDRSHTQGIAELFAMLGARKLTSEEAGDILQNAVRDRVCADALARRLLPLLSTDSERAALAYIVSWLRVAGGNSILPPWVLRRFPLVSGLLDHLREIPCENPSCGYCRRFHDASGQLRRFFGFERFRQVPATQDGSSLQERIVSEGICGRPLLAILPTGGGKSLCYQLPALTRYDRRGLLTVVITPLQALMKDQVDNLTSRTGTPCAAALYGLLTPPERGEVLERIRLGDVAILYVSPEQLRNRTFRRVIGMREIGAWVFDEAHCLSKWGHDFRPDYLYAGRFIREMAAEQRVAIPPVFCFTATAKQDVKEEILEYFKKELLQELTVYEAGVERENLRFDVRVVKRTEKYEAIHTTLSERLAAHLDGCAIVYTATRQGAEDIADFLRFKGWTAAAFHGGMNAPEKRAVQDAFMTGDLAVITATNAFGMGIDKENIRLVLHADIPGSLESYLQEAGRAGRDLRDAECVLLYDEQDVETQFRLNSLSRLTRRDITQILRGLKRAARNPSGDVVITTGELLRDDAVETSFDSADLDADTKVKTAVAWLEKAHLIERNENLTRVFQGKLMVRNLDEARTRIAKLNLPESQQKKWLAITEALINADVDDKLKADDLAELPAFKESRDPQASPAERLMRTSEKVLRTLHRMAEAGLIEKGIVLSAFVRHKVKNPSMAMLEQISTVEEKMLKALQEASPDAAELGWVDLSLRRLNQRLKDEGLETSPELLRGLLKSVSLDGKGLAGSRGSLQFRHVSDDHYRVKMLRDWEALRATSRKRRAVARVILDAILSRIPEGTGPSAEVLVDFATEDLLRALKSHLYLSQSLKDPLAAIDRGLLYMHEHKVIILQQGLAVFRQAMSVRILPESGHRRYGKSDYEPLKIHYQERVFQVHVMNEYARRGAEKIKQALDLVLAYFTLDKTAFIRKFFPGRKELLDRAVSEAAYRRIVDELADPAQMAVVSAGEDRNMLVLAGPGAGKTRVVVHRCAYLLQVLRARPESILIVCFNHSAAVSLRRRLYELVGDAARGVTVQTYHGIAMRITGTSFAELAERDRGGEPPFDELIPEATRVLNGETDIPGFQPDEVRDRLLGRFRHILVDEYQDIDLEQYRLISALAGREDPDPDRKLTILAVGDDDQNIYTFRGANIQFILRFREDYRAQVHFLVQNYRSTAHIIEASNALIRLNRDRMKTDHPIRIDRHRAGQPRGGAWALIDPLGGGRVQRVRVHSGRDQVDAVLSEIRRLQSLCHDFSWTELAILSRTRGNLAPVRAACEVSKIPIQWGIGRQAAPALHRIREVHAFLDLLKQEGRASLRASTLETLLERLAGAQASSPWWRLLGDLIGHWKDETADSELPASMAIELFYESLAERRRENRMGSGVLLTTVHGAKGMELDHVFLLDGDWLSGANSGETEEEERRVFYVGMTRARLTLTLFERADQRSPHLKALQGDAILRREATGSEEHLAEEVHFTRYEALGLEDIHLGYAGRFPDTHPIHRRLARLEAGDILMPLMQGEVVVLVDSENQPVARLSRKGGECWRRRLDDVKGFRVLAMLKRTALDGEPAFRKNCRSGIWEFPWLEAVLSRSREGR